MIAALLLPFAHAAHWYFMPLYAAPVLLVLYGALKTARDERRQPPERKSREAKRTKR
jgi:hypothetical protein